MKGRDETCKACLGASNLLGTVHWQRALPGIYGQPASPAGRGGSAVVTSVGCPGHGRSGDTSSSPAKYVNMATRGKVYAGWSRSKIYRFVRGLGRCSAIGVAVNMRLQSLSQCFSWGCGMDAVHVLFCVPAGSQCSGGWH